MAKPPVPTEVPEIEWIEIDGQNLPFQRLRCKCREHLICIVYAWSRCGFCGVKPRVRKVSD